MNEDYQARAEVAEAEARELRLQVEALKSEVEEWRDAHGLKPVKAKPKPDYEDAAVAPAWATASLLREFADLFERKQRGFGILLVVKDEKVTGYVAEARGILPERIKFALSQPYDLNLVSTKDAMT